MPSEGFDYECDKESADLVFNASLRIDVIADLNKDNTLFDLSMYAVSRRSNTTLSTVLESFQSAAGY